MFGISTGEVAILLVIAIIVLDPEKLKNLQKISVLRLGSLEELVMILRKI